MSLLNTRRALTEALVARLSTISDEEDNDIEQFMQQGDLILVDLILTNNQQNLIDEAESCFSESSHALISMSCEEIGDLKHDLIVNDLFYSGILLVDLAEFQSGDTTAIFQVDSIERLQ